MVHFIPKEWKARDDVFITGIYKLGRKEEDAISVSLRHLRNFEDLKVGKDEYIVFAVLVNIEELKLLNALVKSSEYGLRRLSLFKKDLEIPIDLYFEKTLSCLIGRLETQDKHWCFREIILRDYTNGDYSILSPCKTLADSLFNGFYCYKEGEIQRLVSLFYKGNISNFFKKAGREQCIWICPFFEEQVNNTEIYLVEGRRKRTNKEKADETSLSKIFKKLLGL